MKKNKNSLYVVIILLGISLLIYFCFPKPPCSLSVFDKRAVWFSYIDLAQFSYDSKKEFRDDFLEALDNVKENQCNTVIVQVRPFSDALYQSKLYPLSKVICQKSSLSFDPLEEMVSMAHQNELMIEAWINPYRISLNEQTYSQFLQYSRYRSWLENSDQTIAYGEYKYILNPASQDVRDYVVAGVLEIVENYHVDGIHFDDYFYVEGTHGTTTQDERIDNVNMLIQDVYQSIKSVDEDITFGISPQGNYENCMNEGVDIDTWLKEEGYVDYVMPQIYWSDSYNGETMFSHRSRLFSELKRNPQVQLYAGLALYHSGEELEFDQGWSQEHNNISKQIQILYQNGYKGYSLFSYSSLLNEAGEKEMDELLRVHPNE